MKVLGISPLDKDSTVAIVEDGEILFAAGEERFSRTKQQAGFPQLALEAALDYTGLQMQDFDLVCYPFLTWENEQKLFHKNLEDEKTFIKGFQPADLSRQVKEALEKVPDRNQPIHGLEHPNAIMEKSFLHSSFYSMAGAQKLASNNAAFKASRQWGEAATESFKRWEQDLNNGLAENGWTKPVKRMDHHLSHAANSFQIGNTPMPSWKRAFCTARFTAWRGPRNWLPTTPRSRHRASGVRLQPRASNAGSRILIMDWPKMAGPNQSSAWITIFPMPPTVFCAAGLTVPCV